MSTNNGAMMQYFHWYTPGDGKLWKQLADESQKLAEAGFTALWLPPAYKGAAGGMDVGYGVYDLFDLGEFDQKDSIRTKYGTRDEYLAGIKAAQKAGMQVYADVVFNHKLGADEAELFKATPFNPRNRKEAMGELQEIRAWTQYNFPGRGDKYSTLKWHWWHFNAIDHNELDDRNDAIYLFEGKSFNDGVDLTLGNFDYLMGCNLDFDNPDVRKELFYWGEWYLETTGVDGFRFDATKHVDSEFFLEWLDHIREHSGRKLFAVGEYWSNISEALEHFIKETDGSMMLFDVHLHYNFAAAGKQGKDFNLQTIFDDTLVKEQPTLAVTFVNNHDTQQLQFLESVVEAWFKPIAYALILLRRDGYPCVFAADYYGANYKDRGTDGNEYEIWMESHQWLIDQFLSVRKEYAHGDQYDYFDHPNCIGWTRIGQKAKQRGMAVLISNGDDGFKNMETSSPDTAYIDITKQIAGTITTNKAGWGEFRCKGGSVSVWVPK
ncbi:MAG: alpha-amylase [Ignavibacteriae bacterium HGW-Ignavibacteriae-1]|jgi:alpha-amylase|nr:MAG: alpha-amylase [Ignavibacteriae bacterium HGW-Ignavibacteriae-1]